MSAINAYRRGLCEVAHELLWWGYEAARSQIHARRQEDEITNYIYEGMLDKLNEPQLDQSYNRYEPHREWHIVGTSRTGKSCQRIDIVVRFTDTRPREKFCFEAKRLKVKSHGIGDYTGPEGMGCYLNEEYAPEDPDAAMVGYLQSDDAKKWLAKLKAKYRDGGNPLSCVTDPGVALQPVLIHDQLVNEWQSEHARPTRGNITLYHIFLDCV